MTLLALLLGLALVLALGCVYAFAQYFATCFRRDALLPLPRTVPYNLEVVSVREGRIKLRPLSDDGPGDWSRPGHFGLQWATGYSFVGPIVERYTRTVVRTFEPIDGQVPKATQLARLDGFAFPGDNYIRARHRLIPVAQAQSRRLLSSFNTAHWDHCAENMRHN